MKTTINLENYTFSGKNNPLYQISDDPVNGLVRVIEINRVEFALDIDMISIKATTYYIDSTREIIVFNKRTLVENADWDIIKGDKTIQIDAEWNPIPNPDFVEGEEVTPENYPYLLTDAYVQFKDIAVALNTPVLEMFILSNDEKGVYN